MKHYDRPGEGRFYVNRKPLGEKVVGSVEIRGVRYKKVTDSIELTYADGSKEVVTENERLEVDHS